MGEIDIRWIQRKPSLLGFDFRTTTVEEERSTLGQTTVAQSLPEQYEETFTNILSVPSWLIRLLWQKAMAEQSKYLSISH